jgi:multicomponent Na+:H+ antiporter subunit G
MTLMDWASLPFLFAGAFFLFVSAAGLIRLPDFFSRAHAVGKSETLGSFLILVGLILHHGLVLESGKLLLITLFIAITNPTGIHTLTRAALRAGQDIWIQPQDRGRRAKEVQTTADDSPAPTGGGS